MLENEPENVSHLYIEMLLFRDFDKEKKEEFYVQLNQFIERIRELGFKDLVFRISFFDELIYADNNHRFVKSTVNRTNQRLSKDGLRKYYLKIDIGDLEIIRDMKDISIENYQGYSGKRMKWEDL